MYNNYYYPFAYTL